MTHLDPEARVLVRLPNWLGDAVMAEPVVRALRELRGPEADPRLTLVGPPVSLALYRRRVGVTRLLVLDEARSHRDWRGYDVALLLDGSWRSTFAAWRARVPVRVGFASGGRGPLLTRAVDAATELGPGALGRGRPPGENGARSRARRLPRPFGAAVAELAGFLGVFPAGTRPRFEASPEARAELAERLAGLGVDPQDELVLVNVGARPGSSKGYPEEAWTEVVRGLLGADGAAAGRRVVLLGGPGEEPRLEAVAAPFRGDPRVVPLLDPLADLEQVLALGERARLALCTDGGTRHVLRAAGTPAVTLFGPSDVRHTADHLRGEDLLRREVPCGPCHRERCPLTGTDAELRCWGELSPARVLDAARARLAPA